MNDKSWMLNAEAIGYAKDCINAVKKELGIKLALSNPEFVILLHAYVEMLESDELSMAYSKLISMAGPGTIIHSLPPKNPKVVDLPVKKAVGESFSSNSGDTGELITSNGKSYPRWQNGKEFRGLYRGQPSYR